MGHYFLDIQYFEIWIRSHIKNRTRIRIRHYIENLDPTKATGSATLAISAMRSVFLLSNVSKYYRINTTHDVNYIS